MRTPVFGLGLMLTACAGAGSPGVDPGADLAEGPGPASDSRETDPPTVETPECEPTEAAERSVEFGSNGLNLKGTLSLPILCPEDRVPAVVLVHGSGPHDRNSALGGQLSMAFGFQIPVFEQIARELSKAGLAVLRYDKRTCGSFNGCAENGYPTPDPAITIQAFLDDALAAADWVKRQPNIDPNVVIIAGHSQGGQLVPHALRDRPWLAAGMLIAAPFRAIDATMAYQAEFTRTLLRENGMSEAQIDSTLSDLDSTVDALAQLRAGTYAGARISSASTAFWRSWMDLSDDTPGILESLDRPLFVISGGYDWNVPPSENDLWKSAFAALAIKPGHRNQIIDCVTHALNCVSQPDYKAIRPTDIGSEVSEEFLAVMRDFIKSDIGGKQR